MTEAEWLVGTSPQKMLRFLLGTDYPRVQDVESFPACKGSDRKLRVFACACYYRVRHLLPNVLAQAAVEVAERFADATAKREDLQQAEASVWEPLRALEQRWQASRGAERTALQPTHEALALALQVVWAQAPKAAYYASSNACWTVAAIANPGAACSDAAFVASELAEGKVQAEILRCIFGNLFRTVVARAAVFRWSDATVRKIAQVIYRNGAFNRLPVLADALEKAGCTDPAILQHLRGPGPHVRGCWPLDLLLDKG
jgi:hypothetical protein